MKCEERQERHFSRVACAGAWKHEWPDGLSAALSARRVQEMRLNETGGSQVME